VDNGEKDKESQQSEAFDYLKWKLLLLKRMQADEEEANKSKKRGRGKEPGLKTPKKAKISG